MTFKVDDWARCRTHGKLVRVVHASHQDYLQAIGCHGTTTSACLIPCVPTDLEKREVMNDWAIHGLIRLKVNMQQAIRNGWPTEPYRYRASFDLKELASAVEAS